jgi:hypothetical protein
VTFSLEAPTRAGLQEGRELRSYSSQNLVASGPKGQIIMKKHHSKNQQFCEHHGKASLALGAETIRHLSVTDLRQVVAGCDTTSVTTERPGIATNRTQSGENC